MREHKFRAWDKSGNRMGQVMSLTRPEQTQFILVKFPNEEFAEAIEYSRLIIMEFINLLDKNDVEIYEGDIVKSPDCDNAMTVRYEEIYLSDDMTAPGIGYQFNTEPYQMEIIGNIFENPELLGDR